jgi:hypothetical protein
LEKASVNINDNNKSAYLEQVLLHESEERRGYKVEPNIPQYLNHVSKCIEQRDKRLGKEISGNRKDRLEIKKLSDGLSIDKSVENKHEKNIAKKKSNSIEI